jgi:hypothetical protein
MVLNFRVAYFISKIDVLQSYHLLYSGVVVQQRQAIMTATFTSKIAVGPGFNLSSFLIKLRQRATLISVLMYFNKKDVFAI